MRFYAAAVVALALGGCSATHPLQPGSSSRIPDGEWELATSSFVEGGRMPGVPRARLAFRDGRISVFSGCNTATAPVRDAGGRLRTGELATPRTCPQPVASFDARFFRLLRGEPVYRIEGDTLTLADGDHSARFRRVQ